MDTITDIEEAVAHLQIDRTHVRQAIRDAERRYSGKADRPDLMDLASEAAIVEIRRQIGNSWSARKVAYYAQVALLQRIDAELIEMIRNDATYSIPTKRRPGLEGARQVVGGFLRTMHDAAQVMLPDEARQAESIRLAKAISPEGSQS